MDQVHIHLLITHLPIFGALFGVLVLVHGMGTRSDQTKIAAYYIMIVSSVGASIAYFTGEGAEEAIEHIPGIAKSMIHQHEDFALYALIALIAAGVVSLGGLYLTIKKSSLANTIALLTLVISLVSLGLVARTGYLGGQIRHTEIGAAASTQGDSKKRKIDGSTKQFNQYENNTLTSCSPHRAGCVYWKIETTR